MGRKSSQRKKRSEIKSKMKIIKETTGDRRNRNKIVYLNFYHWKSIFRNFGTGIYTNEGRIYKGGVIITGFLIKSGMTQTFYNQYYFVPFVPSL